MSGAQFSSGSDDSDSDDFSDEQEDFVNWFVRKRENSWLVPIERAFIEDSFNLYGLRSMAGFSKVIQLMLGTIPAGTRSFECDLYSVARPIYLLIHARFILTGSGLQLMHKKYAEKEFGTCPRHLCNDAAVLPVGVHNELHILPVRVFCPCCEDLYVPVHRSSGREPAGMEYSDDEEDDAAVRDAHSIDGAAFGTTFPHMLLLMRPPALSILDPPSQSKTYVPRVFGFRVHSQRGRPPRQLGDASGVYSVCASQYVAAGSSKNGERVLCGAGVVAAGAESSAAHAASGAAATAIDRSSTIANATSSSSLRQPRRGGEPSLTSSSSSASFAAASGAAATATRASSSGAGKGKGATPAPSAPASCSVEGGKDDSGEECGPPIEAACGLVAAAGEAPFFETLLAVVPHVVASSLKPDQPSAQGAPPVIPMFIFDTPGVPGGIPAYCRWIPRSNGSESAAARPAIAQEEDLRFVHRHRVADALHPRGRDIAPRFDDDDDTGSAVRVTGTSSRKDSTKSLLINPLSRTADVAAAAAAATAVVAPAASSVNGNGSKGSGPLIGKSSITNSSGAGKVLQSSDDQTRPGDGSDDAFARRALEAQFLFRRGRPITAPYQPGGPADDFASDSDDEDAKIGSKRKRS